MNLRKDPFRAEQVGTTGNSADGEMALVLVERVSKHFINLVARHGLEIDFLRGLQANFEVAILLFKPSPVLGDLLESPKQLENWLLELAVDRDHGVDFLRVRPVVWIATGAPRDVLFPILQPKILPENPRLFHRIWNNTVEFQEEVVSFFQSTLRELAQILYVLDILSEVVLFIVQLRFFAIRVHNLHFRFLLVLLRVF